VAEELGLVSVWWTVRGFERVLQQLSVIWEKLGLQIIAWQQAGFHCVSQGGLVSVEEEKNYLYHSSQKVQGELEQLEREYAVSAH
jgi:hypothetical protein